MINTKKTLATLLLGTSMLMSCNKILNSPKIYLNAPEARGYDVALWDDKQGSFRIRINNCDRIGPNDGSLTLTFYGDNEKIRAYDLYVGTVKKGSYLDRMTVDSLINIYYKLQDRK